MEITTSRRLRLTNNTLSAVVLILAIYIILVPILPDISWWTTHHTPFKSGNNVSVPAAADDKKESRPKANTLIIPTINLKQEIHDGPDLHQLNFGLWHLPNIGDPSKGGNTVIAGHRFTYSGSGVLYHLDKVKVGDSLTIYWQGERYDYQVSAIKVVPPTEVSVEDNTKDPMLTLITCTPMWTFSDRLIVQAKLTEHIQ